MTQNKTTARESIRAFGAAYDYDATYLLEVLDATPAGLDAFLPVRDLAGFRTKLPLDAHFVARVATMLAEQCGACAQLNLRMAREAEVDRDLMAATVFAPERLPAILMDVRSHALAVASGHPTDPECVAGLREHYGDGAFVELALCITGSRVFPTLKRALGRELSCEVARLEP